MSAHKKYPNREEARIKAMAKMRDLGYAPINSYCEDMDFHHMHLNNDKSIGIFIPREIHRGIYHDPITLKGMKEVNKAALIWLANQEMISPDVNAVYKSKKNKLFEIKSKIKQEVWDRIGKKGTCKDTFSDIIIQMLDQDDDIDRILMFGEEPQTDKLKLLKRKWTK